MGMEKEPGTEAERDQEDLFAEGFSVGDGEDSGGVPPEAGGNGSAGSQSEDDGQEAEQGKPQPESADAAPSGGHPAYVPQYPAVQEPDAPAPASVPQEAPKVATVELPPHIVDEFAELKRANPKAAEVALEDSPDGAAVRARLEQYGASLAEDRAQNALDRREQETRQSEEERRRVTEAIKAHNENFQGTLRREVPGYVAMMNDPGRRTEAAQYQQDVLNWIASKPYAEAAPLMEVARQGREPSQVAALIKQFESERGRATAKRPDPTGALAVPARGAPAAPTGVGDKDDYDAGWNANTSE